MSTVIPTAEQVEEVMAQAVAGLELPDTVADVTDWTETASGRCFIEFTAPSPTWAHTIGSTALMLFRARGQDIDIQTEDSRIVFRCMPNH